MWNKTVKNLPQNQYKTETSQPILILNLTEIKTNGVL